MPVDAVLPVPAIAADAAGFKTCSGDGPRHRNLDLRTDSRTIPIASASNRSKELSERCFETASSLMDSRATWPLVMAWAALAGLLLINLPAFLYMGLDSDISMYDLVARRVLRGDVHYRDLLETNFPGIVWLHIAFRSLFGWSSEALRSVDFSIIACSTYLLIRCLPRSIPAWGRPTVAAILLSFYLATNEWCHCQRDTWMLLPALVAMRLRSRQVERLRQPETPLRGLAGWSFVEGLLWGSAVWIKPFVAVPAAMCWLLAAGLAWNRAGLKKRLMIDALAVVAGGLVIGGAGIGWLVGTGAWPAFVDVMFDWNREYFVHDVMGGERWLGLLGFVNRFFPWVLVHVAAVPIATAAVWRAWQTRSMVTGENSAGLPRASVETCHSGLAVFYENITRSVMTTVLAVFYLAWLGQAIVLQHLFDYVHVPPILLGLTVLASYGFSRMREQRGLLAVAFLVFCLAWTLPGLCVRNGSAWLQCLTAESTAGVRDRVVRLHRVNWTDMGRVAAFLRDQKIRDGELTSFSLPTVALYGDLDLKPSTRYVFLQDHLDIFIKRRPLIRAAVVNSRQKYLVCDLDRYNMEKVREALDATTDSSGTSRWADRIAFRAGNYVVFQLGAATMPAWLDENFDSVAR